MKELLELFLTFTKIGALTFGGGYAMLPILQREIVETKKWASDEELTNYFAIGQCTPGTIAVNTATFIGCKRKGAAGGILATLGVALPSILIITVIAAFLQNFANIPAVEDAFSAVRVCVCILIINAVIRLGKTSIRDKVTFAIFIGVFLVSVLTDLSPVLWVAAAAVLGILIQGKKKEPD